MPAPQINRQLTPVAVQQRALTPMVVQHDTSTSTKVAAVAGVSLVTAAVIGALISWPIGRTLDHLWERVRSL